MRVHNIPTILLATAMLSTAFGQAPSPVQGTVVRNADGGVPVFRVEVTSKTIRAVSYHHRKGSTKVDLRGTALMPEARGEAEVTPNDGATRINLRFDHLSNPAQFGVEYQTLVLWGITPEGRTERLGEVTLREADKRNAELYATTDLQSFGMIVTAEPYFSVSRPSDIVVMENFIRTDTTGTIEDVEAKYELLQRGQYTRSIAATGVTAVTADLKVPLQLREARLAMAIARSQGADEYAADTMQKAVNSLTNAEGYYQNKNVDLKMLETSAREATQMAEDARRIATQKQAEATELASARREMEARNAELLAKARASEEARLRARAESDAATSENQKREAEAAMARARKAQADAEAAHAAVLQEQQVLAAEKARAVSAREQAEKDAQALRERLREQLNLILVTRDTARGLIVNMSDVLFDTGQATLKPGAREKLAKVSGILVAYPTLHLAVEGHTDSTGSDELNMKLSNQRAESVRTYLIQNGTPEANIAATGFGKTRPVASNDTAAGRQQNRRVEMVVSGEVIGQPISGN